jgi:predicted AlkP superfamily phosphohydrolase/phosphomutase
VPVRLALIAVACALAGSGCRRDARRGDAAASAAAPGRHPGRVVLLALDGVDPRRLESWMDEGRLPAFDALRRRGAYTWLRTVDPPSCEAAWTAFVTGLPPADSGVSGPWSRDPDAYGLVSGTIRLDDADAPPRPTAVRSGTAFWTLLAQNGVRVRVLWAPYEVPPERLPDGEILAGRGIPDIGGRPGRSLLLAADFPEATAPGPGIEMVRLNPAAEGWTADVPGPPAPGGRGCLAVTAHVRSLTDPERLAVDLGTNRVELGAGRWSADVPLEFRLAGLRIRAVSRWLALETGDRPRLVAAPIEIDPAFPWMPVSEPGDYAARLADRYGRLPLPGVPGSYAAFEEDAVPADAVLTDLIADLAARRAVLLGELDRGDFDLLVAAIPTIEFASLALTVPGDPEHPAYDGARAAEPIEALGGLRLAEGLLAVYAYVDGLVAEVAARLKPDDTLLLVSDHGFVPYRRSVHLNAWLRREGLLVLLPDRLGAPGAEALRRHPGSERIDWARTQAYAMGGAAVYLNLQGREGRGWVEPGERADALLGRIGEKLEAWTDSEASDASVVRGVRIRGRDLRGRREDRLPDLCIAFAPGYRESRETVEGLVPDTILEPNRTPVGAQHASADAEDVPGLIFSTRPIVRPDASILDVGTSILGHFGVTSVSHGRGNDLWRP